MIKRKWFKTSKERKEHQAKIEEENQKLMSQYDPSKIIKLENGPKPLDFCDAKSKDFRNNGAKISPDMRWLTGGDRFSGSKKDDSNR